jgi:hypothetical protein
VNGLFVFYEKLIMSINTPRPTTHIIGIELMMMAVRFLYIYRIQEKMEQRITATGYMPIPKTKEMFPALKPLSKLIKDKPQITNHGIRHST